MRTIQLGFDQDATLPAVSEHQPVEFACAARPGAWLELTVDAQPAEPFLRPGDSSWRWRWNPGAAVGLHRVALSVTEGDATERRAWQLRVAPRKIDQDRYEALLDDLQQVAYGLAYSLGGGGAEGGGLRREALGPRGRLEEYYAVFEGRLDGLDRAVRRIAARPREQLRGAAEQVPLARAAAIDGAALADLPRGPFDAAPAEVAPELQEALRAGGGLLPHSLRATRGAPTLDIYEHRLLKHLLALLARRAVFLHEIAGREASRLAALENTGAAVGTRRVRAQEIAETSAAAARRLRELRGLPFLDEVGSLPAFRGATPLLQRDAAYREVYRAWQALRQQPLLAFDSPLFSIPIDDLPYLYEAWCALQVAQALLDGGGELREQQLVAAAPAEDEPVLGVSLTEQAPLLVLDRGETTLTLRYQPRYRPRARRGADRLGSLDRYTRVPDLSVEVARPGQPPAVLALDAKYRLDAEGRGVPQDALADAYAYLGAIGRDGARATIAALLLYPGSAAEHYDSGVGVVPLLPGDRAPLDRALEKYLTKL